MNPRPLRTNGARGFTLIEILVVVAIIALLLTILLPTMQRAREMSRTAICGTREREIFKGAHMYSQANDDRLPYFGWYESVQSGDQWWPTQLARILSNQYEIYTCPSDKAPYQIQVEFKKGTIYMVGIPDSGGNAPEEQREGVPLDITYRSACDTLEYIWDLGLPYSYRPRKITSWRRPFDAILMIEASTYVRDDDFDPDKECFRFLKDMPHITDPWYLRQCPHLKSWERHNGTTNILFMDGHVIRHTPEEAVKVALRQAVDLATVVAQPGGVGS